MIIILFQLKLWCQAHHAESDLPRINNTIVPFKEIQNLSSDKSGETNNYMDDLQKINSYIGFLSKSHTFLKYYSILVVIFGTLFNLINFFCFYQMKKRNSQNIYLIFLSLADLFNIQINISVPLIRNLFLHDESFGSNYNKNGKSLLANKLFCILDGYLVEIGLLLPAWIMVLLAAERFIIIMWPLKKNVNINFIVYLAKEYNFTIERSNFKTWCR